MERTKKVEVITIRIEAEHKTALEGFAAADDRTLSSYVGRLLKAHVAEMLASEGSARASKGGRRKSRDGTGNDDGN